MPKLKRKKCIACGGTGLNSKGGACLPCTRNKENRQVRMNNAKKKGNQRSKDNKS